MKRSFCFGVVVLLLTQVAHMQVAAAQDDIKPEDLKKLYDSTLVQLKAAQDRKSQLATENEKLAARVAELEKQVAAQNTQLEDLNHQSKSFADRTFFLRMHFMAWTQFLESNPLIRLRWDLFLDRMTSPLNPSPGIPFIDPQWPLSAKE